MIHHWAHVGNRNCDPWWENETPWHRDWKNLFPEESREISHVDENGEIHRADIRTTTGIYIEIQHSNMSDAERRSRERFYKNMVWVVDAKPFRKNFDFYHLLPDPSSHIAQDKIWFPAQRGMEGPNNGAFWRPSENPEAKPGTGAMVRVRSLREVHDEVMNAYLGHQQYDWVRPRRTWLDADCPVYLDFGDEWLFRLERYGQTNLNCVFRVAKRKFVHDVMIEKHASDIATRFYPIPRQNGR